MFFFQLGIVTIINKFVFCISILNGLCSALFFSPTYANARSLIIHTPQPRPAHRLVDEDDGDVAAGGEAPEGRLDGGEGRRLVHHQEIGRVLAGV